MQSIASFMQLPLAEDSPRKCLNQRQELIKLFVEKLNADRVGKYKPLSPKFIASKMAMAGIKDNQDLYWYYKYCEDAKNFGACWWGSMKSK
jgi:hypothetical protein